MKRQDVLLLLRGSSRAIRTWTSSSSSSRSGSLRRSVATTIATPAARSRSINCHSHSHPVATATPDRTAPAFLGWGDASSGPFQERRRLVAWPLPQQLQHQQVRSHYQYSGPGSYHTHNSTPLEALWVHRDFRHRGFTVGIGGPVGSGKTALVLHLCRALQQPHQPPPQLQQQPGNPDETHSHDHDHSQSHPHPFLPPPPLAVVTNDIFTQEDAEFLVRHQALSADKIRAVETGGCPHAAIREDISSNLSALEDLTLHLGRDGGTTNPAMPLLLCESGGDNLAANFSRELADLTLYVIDVAGGDKVPRKGGPGITQSDLLIVNKIDLAPAVGADLAVMERDAARMRGPGPTVMASVKMGIGMDQIVNFILANYRRAVDLQKTAN